MDKENKKLYIMHLTHAIKPPIVSASGVFVLEYRFAIQVKYYLWYADLLHKFNYGKKLCNVFLFVIFCTIHFCIRIKVYTFTTRGEATATNIIIFVVWLYYDFDYVTEIKITTKKWNPSKIFHASYGIRKRDGINCTMAHVYVAVVCSGQCLSISAIWLNTKLRRGHR